MEQDFYFDVTALQDQLETIGREQDSLRRIKTLIRQMSSLDPERFSAYRKLAAEADSLERSVHRKERAVSDAIHIVKHMQSEIDRKLDDLTVLIRNKERE